LRWIDTELERPRWRATGSFRLIPTLQLGIEYNPAVPEAAPLATWFLLTETERRPALFLGTSSDRIGSPERAQAYYVTVAKYLPPVRTSPYATLNYSEWDRGWNVPFGANVGERWSVTLVWAWLERAGAAFSVGL
jgi:hypothetical protein